MKFYSLYRIFLIAGDLLLAASIMGPELLRLTDFQAGFLKGAAPILLLGALYFLYRARQAGEPRAQCALCRKKQAWLAQRKER